MTDSEIYNETLAPILPPYCLPHYSLLSDINMVQDVEHQLSSTHNSLSSLEGSCEDVLAGGRKNGYMSVVRRFFCLFVLFDFLLISLTWLICIMLMGSNNLIQNLKMQILYYKISTSLFDVILVAFCRFTILLLFYGLLHLNTTFFVAFTTLGTCVFLIFKVVYYSWSNTSQTTFQVILILVSFIIAWAETWFLDFRVLPQELFALNYAQSRNRFSESLSTLLLDHNLRGPVMRHFFRNMNLEAGRCAEDNGSFYTPLNSSSNSGGESDDERTPKMVLNNKYLVLGKNTLEAAWNLLNDQDWKLQKTSFDGDCVYSKHKKQSGRVFLLRAKINIEAQKLLEELFWNVEKLTEWNKTILESRRIQVIDKRTDITYQVSSPGGNGLISSRDFVILRHWDVKGNSFVLAGISIPYPSLPPSENYVRGENGPCCWVMTPSEENQGTCTFEFLLNTNLKGWISQYVVESALTSVLLEYSVCLKEYCESIQRLQNK